MNARVSAIQLTRFQVSDRPLPFDRVPACTNVSVYLYLELLVLTDDTGGDSISEVDVFGVGTAVQNVCSTSCTKQFPFFVS